MVSQEEWLYLAILFTSVPLGWLVARLPPGAARQWYCSIISLILTFGMCGKNVLHPLLTIVVNAVIIRCFPRECHKICFVFSFAYLALFRCATLIGLPNTTEFINAVQLILTLKVVGVAFEVSDTNYRKRGLTPFPTSSANFSPLNTFGNVEPRFMDIVHYCLSFIGLMTGPYYKYKTYDDMVQSVTLDYMPRVRLAYQRLRMLPLYVLSYLVLSTTFSYAMMWDDAFYESTSLSYRILYLMVVFVFFRIKFYIGWLLAEASCIAAGLGVYPAVSNPKPGHGPSEPEKLPAVVDTDTEFSFETIYNINEFEVEFVPTVRGALKAWNMTVQYWLAWHVYRRVPIKSLRTFLVMLVSAYWHGLHGGYYLSLLTVPLMLMAEGVVAGKSPSFWMVFANWFFRMRAFEYMSIGFICLSGARTWRYWSSIYFMGHILAVLILVMGSIYRKMRRHKAHRIEQNGSRPEQDIQMHQNGDALKSHAE